MRRLVLITIMLLMPAVAAGAGPVEDSISRQLLSQGFDEVRISRTLLGRSRIVATSDALRREIVVNPNTGEILRDYIRKQDGGSGFESIFDPNSGGKAARSSRGGSGQDDDDDDDKDDDDDRDDDGDDGDDRDDDKSDNSGRGSSNSGSGSSNSGKGGGDRDDGDDDD